MLKCNSSQLTGMLVDVWGNPDVSNHQEHCSCEKIPASFCLRNYPSHWGSGHQSIHGFLGLQQSTPQTSLQLVQPFVQARQCRTHRNRLTNRPYYIANYICNNSPHLAGATMCPNNNIQISYAICLLYSRVIYFYFKYLKVLNKQKRLTG